MKYYETDSAFEKNVQKVEDLMRKLGLSIESAGVLCISNKSGSGYTNIKMKQINGIKEKMLKL